MDQICTMDIEPKGSRAIDLEQIGRQRFPAGRSHEMVQQSIKYQPGKCFTDLG